MGLIGIFFKGKFCNYLDQKGVDYFNTSGYLLMIHSIYTTWKMDYKTEKSVSIFTQSSQKRQHPERHRALC